MVDNGSDPAVDAAALDAGGLTIRVLRSDANLGPAGGWALGLQSFVESSFGHAWVLDDDIVPEPECLQVLWAEAAEAPERAFLFPRSIQPEGTVGRWGSWCGFLIAKQIVEAVGLPRAELFWWAEDTEYCQWRIPRAGYRRRVVRDAVVHHHAIRRGGNLPAWKYYYESRNMLYLHLHVMRHVGWYPRNMVRLVGRAFVRQRRHRVACLAAIARGVVDGARGRLGIRYPVAALREHRLPDASSATGQGGSGDSLAS